MNKDPKPSLVVVVVTFASGDSMARGGHQQKVEEQFQGCDTDVCAKLGESVFLVNQDTCYSALLKVIDYANRNNGSVMVAELSELAPVVLSPGHAAEKLLKDSERIVRRTKFVPAGS